MGHNKKSRSNERLFYTIKKTGYASASATGSTET